MVYVIDRNGKPLMPTERHGTIRKLLRDGLCKVVRSCPFTIQLFYEIPEPEVQPITLGIDPGSKVLGTAARIEGTKKIVYSAKVVLRTDISSKMKRRASYRRNRRNRKTRYRTPRFLNRTRPKGWLPPSVQSKVNSQTKEIRFIFSVLPVTKVIYEKTSFDIHKLSKNGKIKSWEYAKGDAYGYENSRQYVLTRDKYKCKVCRKSGSKIQLQTHHIIQRKDKGTDKPSNLIVLCSICHVKLHSKKIVLTKNNLKGLIIVNTKDATQVSILSKRLRDLLLDMKVDYSFKLVRTYGYSTKVKRRLLRIPKDHHLDAVACTYKKRPEYKKAERPRVLVIFNKVSVSKGDYQQTKGVRSQQKIPTGKIQGFRKFDTVEYLGSRYIIKGRRSAGYAELMDVEGVPVKLRPVPKLSLLRRVQSRSSTLVNEVTRSSRLRL